MTAPRCSADFDVAMPRCRVRLIQVLALKPSSFQLDLDALQAVSVCASLALVHRT